MSVKGTKKFGYAQLTLTYKTLQQNGLLASSLLDTRMNHRGMASSTNIIGQTEHGNWKLLVKGRAKKTNAKLPELTLPSLIKLYMPWEVIRTKLNLWQLKMLWDWKFNEAEFVDNSKQALVLATKFIVHQRVDYIQRCTTCMGYKQIKHDLIRNNGLETTNPALSWPLKTMRFDKHHILQAMPLKVERMEHYDHKFAFIDMIYFVQRRTNDFAFKLEASELKELMRHYEDVSKFFMPRPIVVAEIFVRYRRDYSVPATERAGHWLISSYKILNLDVIQSL